LSSIQEILQDSLGFSQQQENWGVLSSGTFKEAEEKERKRKTERRKKKSVGVSYLFTFSLLLLLLRFPFSLFFLCFFKCAT